MDALEWLNVGLAACKLKDRQAALDAGKQLKLRMVAKTGVETVPGTSISIPKMGKTPPVESRVLATLVTWCMMDGIKLMSELFGWAKTEP